jgi:hypothetical protein
MRALVRNMAIAGIGLLSEGTGCRAEAGPAAEAAAEPAAEPPALAATAAYEATLQAIEAERQRLAQLYARADEAHERASIRAEARAFVRAAIVGDIFPAWLGMSWGLGANSTANRPHAPGMTVACGYFVSSVLENAGLRVQTRFSYAQAPALTVQRTLAPAAGEVHRFFSVPGETLAAGITKLGAGLYIIGLSNHIGFVVVDDAGVHLVHASYTDDRVVISEPLATAQAIANSRPKGYFVSPVMHDDHLADLWLRGAPVPLRKS